MRLAKRKIQENVTRRNWNNKRAHQKKYPRLRLRSSEDMVLYDVTSYIIWSTHISRLCIRNDMSVRPPNEYNNRTSETYRTGAERRQREVTPCHYGIRNNTVYVIDTHGCERRKYKHVARHTIRHWIVVWHILKCTILTVWVKWSVNRRENPNNTHRRKTSQKRGQF